MTTKSLSNRTPSPPLKTTPKGRKLRAQSTALVPDTAQMLKFKRFVHGSAAAAYRLIGELQSKTQKKQEARSVDGALKPLADDLAAENQRGFAVCMVINKIRKNGRADDDVEAVTALFIDSDGQLPVARIKALQPQLVVETSPDRYHAYWLAKGVALGQFKKLQRALAKKLGTDSSVSNLSRVMRMPGTINHKGQPSLAKIIYQEEAAAPLSVRTIEKRIGLSLTASESDAQAAAAAEAPVKTRQDREGVATAAAKEDVSLVEVRRALAAISRVDDRSVWLKVGMALHSQYPSEQGYKLWERWSRRSVKFEREGQRKAWNGFKAGGGVTIASLFALARKGGWAASLSSEDKAASGFAVSDRFATLAKNKLCYCGDTMKWWAFKSPVWVRSDPALRVVGRAILEKMAQESPSLQRHVRPQGLAAVLRDASSSPLLHINSSEFDRQRDLLAVANGVVDLRTGTLREGKPGDMLARAVPTAFDPEAKCPKFKRFIAFVTRGDKDFAGHLQRALGYTLFGHADEQVFFLLFGDTGNGKGTLFRLVQYVLGNDLVRVVPPNLLASANSGDPQKSSPATMALAGARMYQCSELKDRHFFDTAFIKQLSGSDQLSARGHYGDQSQFTPVGKLWASANSLPEVPEQDAAMWRRFKIIPFLAKVKERDPEFEESLKQEAPGILAWLVRGAVRYAKEGLGTCDAVERAIKKARKESDSVAMWVSARCVKNADATVQSSVAYSDYMKFCRGVDTRHISRQKFARAMCDKGYKRKQTKLYNAFEGLRLRA